MFWMIATALAALVLLPILTAIWRERGSGSERADLVIYRDQLAEVERDLARGVLREEEAERTRLEVQRRLLDADRATSEEVRAAPRWARIALVVLSAGVIVVGSFAIYVRVGAPGYRDLPIAARIALADDTRDGRPSQSEAEARAAPRLPPPAELEPDLDDLMARLRRTLEQRPDDLQGFRLLARNEAATGNIRAARIAQSRLVDLLGADADATEVGILAELMVHATGGLVTNEAEELVDRALALEPDNGRALYLKGVSLAQIGRPDQAFGFWRAALERGPESAPWIASIRAQIPEMAARAGVRYEAPVARGPDANDVAAAADMSPEERSEMISGMVEGLSRRLAEEGGPSADWARLIVALSVLGQTDRARTILDEARHVFAESPEDLAAIDNAASRTGLGG